MFDKFNDDAEMLKVLGHPVRLCIVEGLLNGGCNVSKIQECMSLPQSTISQHLAALRNKGIVKGERHGTEICYRVANE